MTQSTAMIYTEFPLPEWPDTLEVLLFQNFTATAWLANPILVWIMCSVHFEVVSGRDMNIYGLTLLSGPEAPCFKNSFLKGYLLTLNRCNLFDWQFHSYSNYNYLKLLWFVYLTVFFFLSLIRWSLKWQKAVLAVIALENQYKICILSCQTSCKKSNAAASGWKSSIGLFVGAWQGEKGA